MLVCAIRELDDVQTSRCIRIPDSDQFVGRAYRQRFQQDAIDDRKDRGVRTRRKSEQQDGRQGVSGAPAQQAKTEADVTNKIHEGLPETLTSPRDLRSDDLTARHRENAVIV
jgi:hypothetical protein